MSNTSRIESSESLSTFIVIYSRSPGPSARHMCGRLLCTTVTHKLCEDQHFYGQFKHVYELDSVDWYWSQQSRHHQQETR
ncbi:hypothetical protein GHT06_014610 [Daphnia sinensis]|uniref:Uncharacterized protein n=1 Tax=Daphnia sinensis TaxID=1820382 RepID=A0AAD5KR67_9CRUS|nr:hypothetical protein GHT06_014610 [Daphnia sinensis]